MSTGRSYGSCTYKPPAPAGSARLSADLVQLSRCGTMDLKGGPVSSTIHCYECNRDVPTGHCKGGKWGGCCESFTSYTAFDRHRIGPYDSRDGVRRCLTPAEMIAMGGRDTPRGWTFEPPMTPEQRARSRRKENRGAASPEETGEDDPEGGVEAA